MKYKIYTDGSSNQGSKNEIKKKGGWAYLILDENDVIIRECSEKSSDNLSTNNQCEMLGVINSLIACKALKLNGVIEVYSDSAYIVNAFSEGWIDNWIKKGWINALGQPVANKNLWVELIGLTKQLGAKITKIKRNSNTLSKRVDSLAKSKMRD